jgi:hypothetical protein
MSCILIITDGATRTSSAALCASVIGPEIFFFISTEVSAPMSWIGVVHQDLADVAGNLCAKPQSVSVSSGGKRLHKSRRAVLFTAAAVTVIVGMTVNHYGATYAQRMRLCDAPSSATEDKLKPSMSGILVIARILFSSGLSRNAMRVPALPFEDYGAPDSDA